MQATDVELDRPTLHEALERFLLRSAAVEELHASGVISERRCLAEIERLWAQVQEAALTPLPRWRSSHETA